MYMYYRSRVVAASIRIFDLKNKSILNTLEMNPYRGKNRDNGTFIHGGNGEEHRGGAPREGGEVPG